eukprot:g7853.t1
MGNHLLYNFGVGGGGAGADLYGTEPWTFYVKNLLLNFNIAALLAAPALACTWRRWQLFVTLLPMYLTLALFFKMAHKEERFLTMTYPHICLAAAVTLDAFLSLVTKVVKSKTVVGLLAFSIMTFYCGVSFSRSAALWHHFKAPLQIYDAWHRVHPGWVATDGRLPDHDAFIPTELHEWMGGIMANA